MKAVRWTALTGIALLLLLIGLALASHNWDPMAFVLDRPTDVPPDQTWGIGYDGQQAYAIALDPVHPSDALDHKAYRYMRILYPLAASLVAPNPALIPWALIVVNLISAGISIWILAYLLERRGAPAWPALVMALSFAYFIGLRLDLNEPLAFCLTLAGLLAWERDRTGAAVLYFGLAVLAKEVVLVFPIALAAAEIRTTRRVRALVLAAAPACIYLLWAGVVNLWIGENPFGTAQSNLNLLPFAGLLELEGFQARFMIVLWVVGPAVVLGLMALRDLATRSGAGGVEAWMVLANVALIATLPNLTWFDPLAVLRMSVGLILAGVLYLGARWRRGLPFAAAIWGPSILIAFLLPGFIL
ncbi:MAG: hypothetical protein JXA97_05310 [Anaerolineales bacterium]|nr:hypothetical protein [Anaerolineales bacterium]